MLTNWKKYYMDKINKDLMAEYNFGSVMQIPKLEKVVVNAGVGDATKDAKMIESMFNEIESIVCQKPVMTKSKKAIATFKLRENQNIGVKVTLRGERMWNFIANLINVALPRVRDFKGLSLKAFDGHGDYTIGIKEQIVFTEIFFDKIKRVRGFDITFVTSASDDKIAFSMLKSIGLPFGKR